MDNQYYIINNGNVYGYNLYIRKITDVFELLIRPSEYIMEVILDEPLIKWCWYDITKLKLGKSYDLLDLNTYRYFISLGVDIQINNIIRWACDYNHINIVQFLIENGTDIQANNNQAIQAASR